MNAGHPAPFLVRDGAVTPLELTVQPPLGVSTNPYQADAVTLKPGDRLLMATDGYLEGRTGRVDIDGVLAASLDRHPRQIVQELAQRVLEVTGGNLRDDATALCLDWYGPTGTSNAIGGASQARATS